MSAQDEYVLVQRIVSVLFQRGHMMTRFTIEYLLGQINQHIERMIDLNDNIERNHLDEQTLLLQQLNEVNERIRMEEREPRYINQPQVQFIYRQGQQGIQGIQGQQGIINMDIDVDTDDGSSQQTELDNNQPFTFHPPINRRLFVDTESTIIPSRNNPVERSKVIARKKLEEPCPSECSICQETPKHKDAVCTECNHYYCKGCWESWMNADGSNKKCPTCRKDMPRITIFKGRAPNRRNIV